MELPTIRKWKSLTVIAMVSCVPVITAAKSYDDLSVEKQILRNIRLWYNPNIAREKFLSTTPMNGLTSNLKTGDIVLCSGETNYVSDGVRMMTSSPYSHVAMAYQPTYRKRPLLWHSLRTASGWHQYDSDAVVDGPTLTDAYDYIHDFASVQQDGICMVRPFKGTDEQRTHLANVIEDLQQKWRGNLIYPAPWPHVFFDYTLSHTFGFTYFHPPGTSCSTTVAETLMIAGFLEQGDYDHLIKYAPGDFADVEGSKGGLFEERLLDSVKYGHSEWIVDGIVTEDELVAAYEAADAMESPMASNWTMPLMSISIST